MFGKYKYLAIIRYNVLNLLVAVFEKIKSVNQHADVKFYILNHYCPVKDRINSIGY